MFIGLIFANMLELARKDFVSDDAEILDIDLLPEFF